VGTSVEFKPRYTATMGSTTSATLGTSIARNMHRRIDRQNIGMTVLLCMKLDGIRIRASWSHGRLAGILHSIGRSIDTSRGASNRRSDHLLTVSLRLRALQLSVPPEVCSRGAESMASRVATQPGELDVVHGIMASSC
jgi:hypothetical protein